MSIAIKGVTPIKKDNKVFLPLEEQIKQEIMLKSGKTLTLEEILYNPQVLESADESIT